MLRRQRGTGAGATTSHIIPPPGGSVERERGSPEALEITIGSTAMILGGLVAMFFGVDAEGKSLEDVARPLSVLAKPPESIFRSGGRPG
jgi:hypothetical protein